MFDRDSHWLGKLYQLIVDSPGITFPKLAQRCKKLATEEVSGYLNRLIDQGKIRNCWHDLRGGKTTWAFHPCAPSRDEPTDKLESMLRKAKHHYAAGLDCVNSALQIVDEMATAGLVPPAAIIELRPDGYQTATEPAV